MAAKPPRGCVRRRSVVLCRTVTLCAGTGLKPCGQCGGSGVNQEDLYGGRFKAGDVCWLCEVRSGAAPAGSAHLHARLVRRSC